MPEKAQNPLLSSQKSSESSLHVALHPLVLLTISDYITRHTLRNLPGPIVGALLGQQDGREITVEHAFECLLVDVGGETLIHMDWFENRLQQMKDVHKVPALDFVGWYTVLPTSGPQPVHLPIHQQIVDSYNEFPILLGFHPTAVLDGSVGGKLPLTIYESNYEADEIPAESGEDKEMKDEDSYLGFKFKELPYSVETGEAEMIGVDFVARGGGNATAVAAGPAALKADDSSTSKGKVRAPKKGEGHESELARVDDQHTLSREDEELIASLTAKANAIKMLHARINLIATYLKSLPPSYISSAVPETAESSTNDRVPVNHSVLRAIQALLSRLSSLIPADAVAFEQELLSEKNDVDLVSLLSVLTKNIKDIRETGRKFSVVENGKYAKVKPDGRGSWDIPGHILGVGDLLP